MDTNSAYLYPECKEELYLSQPKGLESPGKEDWLWKVHKCIYGLKQSGHEWNQLITATVLELGFTQSKSDPCLFTLNKSNEFAILLLYVDDMLLAADKPDLLTSISNGLQKKFKMTSTPLSWMLGLCIEQSSDSIRLHQELYVTNLLKKFKMIDCNPARTPMLENHDDGTASPPFNDVNLYQSLLGSLMYLAVQTRPDISFAIGKLARTACNPTEKDFAALKRMLAYLKHTINYGITFYHGNISDNSFIGYSDSDFAEDRITRKSTTGSILTFNGTPLSWNSKLQPLVTESSTEAELVAAHFVSKAVLNLKTILSELKLIDSAISVPIYIDNNSTLALIHGNQSNRRTKHIDIRYFKMREYHSDASLIYKKIPTAENFADLLTKPLNGPKIKSFVSNLNMIGELRGSVANQGTPGNSP